MTSKLRPSLVVDYYITLGIEGVGIYSIEAIFNIQKRLPKSLSRGFQDLKSMGVTIGKTFKF